MTLQVYADHAALSLAAAVLFSVQAQEAVQTRGRFVVALAGGNTPRGTYDILAGLPFRGEVPWDKVHVFFGDERCVPPDDLRSNQRMVREALLEHVPIPQNQIHPILCLASPEEAAGRYETILRGFFAVGPPRFDLVLLGMGEDGHTASLFPNTPALDEQDRWAVGVCPPTQELCRVTLTRPTINQAAVIAFLVSGEDKAATLREVQEGPHDPHRLPAQLIQPSEGQLLWLVDQAAARLLNLQ
jgi:6-phosphogluconolactonase